MWHFYNIISLKELPCFIKATLEHLSFTSFKACFQFSSIKMSPIRCLCVLFFPTEAHSKSFQTSKIELAAKIVNDSLFIKSVRVILVRTFLRADQNNSEYEHSLRSVSAIKEINLNRCLTGFSRCPCSVFLLNIMIYKEEFLNIRSRMQDGKMLNKKLCILNTCKY